MLLAVVLEEERRSKEDVRESKDQMGLAAQAANAEMWVWDVSNNRAVRCSASSPTPVSISVRSIPCEVVNGIAAHLPAWPETQLPKTRILEVTSLHPAPQLELATFDKHQAGRFTRAFSYSGPTTIVHVERNAQEGKNVYVDCDLAMAELPPELVGADWVQAANGDSLYHAVDLMELSVPGGVMVWVAHDDRLPRPEWLTNLFSATSSRIMLSGRSRTLFRRHIERDESLTLGPNVDNARIESAEMYVVFVTPQLKASAAQAKKEEH